MTLQFYGANKIAMTEHITMIPSDVRYHKNNTIECKPVYERWNMNDCKNACIYKEDAIEDALKLSDLTNPNELRI